MINNLTAAQQLAIIAEVFLKIAINFGPIVILAIAAGVLLHVQEGRTK